MNILAKIILTPFFIIGSALGFYNTTESPTLSAALPQGVAVFETALQSPISSSATSMTLTANSVRGGSTLSGYNCFTIDEGSSQAEFVCGTVSGTTVSSLTRGVDPVTATTTNATLQFAHRRGANVKITDFPLVQIIRNQLNGNDTFNNILNYQYSPDYTSASTTAVASKGYVDGVAFSGSPDASETVKGISELSTTAEAAAGTSAGATGARLVIPASMCSSTPSANVLCVITSAAGKIAQGFLDLTQSFTWSGNQMFNASTTMTATTTIAASNVLSRAVFFNNLPYAFPSSRGATNSVLTENGSGTLTWSTPSVARYTYASTSLGATATNGYATSTANMVIPALNASSTVTFKGNFVCDNSSNGDGQCIVMLKKSTGETIADISPQTMDSASSQTYNFNADILSSVGGASTWSVIGNTSQIKGSANSTATVGGGEVVNSTHSISLSSGATLVVVVRSTNANTPITLTNYSIVVNP